VKADHVRLLLSSFENAIDRLSEALDQPKNDFVRDSAIQRFEFTFEFAWKLLKSFLFLQGLEARSPRAAIRAAFEIGLIHEDEPWMGLLELRNLTTHTYDEGVSERVYNHLPATMGLFRQLASRIRDELALP
jgi:nucleotidyltransferase substrate binding protein (TIGR01987 family)